MKIEDRLMILPPDTETRLWEMTDAFCVVATRPPRLHGPEVLLKPGQMPCWVNHGAGFAWPDAAGLAPLQAALAELRSAGGRDKQQPLHPLRLA